VHAIEGAQAHRERVRGICMTPDARQVASLSRDGTLRLWHLEWELRV
jgi:WD40 repeat protein